VAHDVVLRRGLVVTPGGILHADVGIAGGVFVEIGAPGSVGGGRREFDVEGKILLPGLFDPHIHFGFGDDIGDDTMLEDFKHNTKDCLVGGVTSIATTTMTGTDSLVSLFERARRCAEGHSWVDYKVTSVVGTRDHVAEIPAVAGRGGVSFKFFTGYIGEQAAAFGMSPEGITPDFFWAACESLAKSGPPTFAKIHAEDPYVRGVLVDQLRRQGRPDTLVAWAESSPEWAESLQIYTYGLIAHDKRVPLYPVHVSAAHTVDTIRHLRSQGMNIVGETLSCFLCTTAPEMDAKGMGGKAKIQPPIRFEKDRERLWQGIKDGTISIVGTDSLTYSSLYKEGIDFWECRVGINLQVADTLALLFDEGINKGRIDLQTLARIVSENAAKMYGLYPQKGAIAVGSDADLVVLDPDQEVTLGTGRYRGTMDYSLWEGRKVKGIPTMTFVRGELSMQDGEIVADKPGGRFIEQMLKPRGV
jgi:dihydropyrimidinase